MFGWDLMWRSCHLASKWKSSLRDSISIWMPNGKSIWHGLTWRGLTEATWKLSLLDSISNMRFFKFNALLFLSTLTHPFTLSEPHQSNPLPLSALSVRPSPSLSLTDLDPLSLTLSFSHFLNLTDTDVDANPNSLTLSASPTPTSTPTHSHSPSHSLTHRPTITHPCHSFYSLTLPLLSLSL